MSTKQFQVLFLRICSSDFRLATNFIIHKCRRYFFAYNPARQMMTYLVFILCFDTPPK